MTAQKAGIMLTLLLPRLRLRSRSVEAVSALLLRRPNRRKLLQSLSKEKLIRHFEVANRLAEQHETARATYEGKVERLNAFMQTESIMAIPATIARVS
jgi:hypothetical protein